MIGAGLIKWTEQELDKKKKSDNEHNQLSQLTIIIPSFCRQDYLVRQVVFWAFTDVNVVIADGSPELLDVSLIDMISDLPNISYNHLVDSYTSRIKKSCSYINTPYAMCLADDDLYLKKGLCRAIDYLNQNAGVVACMGQILGVDYDLQKQHGFYFPYGGSLRSYQVKSEDPVTRLKYALNGYRTATSYAIYRAQTFKDVWHGIQTTSCLEATEYEHAMATYMHGSLSTIEDFYWLRSYECEPVDSLIDGTRETTFDVWWSKNEYKQECLFLVERLVIKLCDNSNVEKNQSRDIINELIGYILNRKHVGLMNQTISLIFIRRIFKILTMFSFVENVVSKLRSTAVGIAIRSRIRTLIRGKKMQFVASDGSSLCKHTLAELEETLIWVDDFHLARRSSPN
jgi:glycosyltransferase domain-containing protein